MNVRPVVVVVRRPSPALPQGVNLVTCGPIQIEARTGQVEKSDDGCIVRGAARVTNVTRQLVAVSWGTVGCSQCSQQGPYGKLLKPGESVDIPAPPDGASWYVVALTFGQVEAGMLAIGLAGLGILALAGYGVYALIRGRR